MLGAVDGYADALAHVRREIGLICYFGINPRHVRKLVAREMQLRPLRELERWLTERHTTVRAAYDATRKQVA